ncbi:hypothetical protein A2V82_07720 [candidate division KSB1 bacterium RBG_16_48_16]|nr:MAG: hypothetical protein A2V82_07720 [candidate division KSB1 bacterium RBG_16_48_16]
MQEQVESMQQSGIPGNNVSSGLNEEKLRRESGVTGICTEIKSVLEPCLLPPDLKIAFLVKPQYDFFLKDIIRHFSKLCQVKKFIVTHTTQIEQAMIWADVCWFEWCDELIAIATKLDLSEKKKIICRLHSYEAFTNILQHVNWKRVDKVVFVAPHIREIALQQTSQLEKQNTCIIPNAVNPDRVLFKERSQGFNIAFVGHINYKKGPMLLLHAFHQLVQVDGRYQVFLAADFQDLRYNLYFSQMIRELDLDKNVHLAGWVDDIPNWLLDKNYIVSTSVLEGHPVGIMEAMACGIKPVIHNFVGAKGIFPEKYLWNTIPGFIQHIRDEAYCSREYREFANNYSLEKQMKSISRILFDNDKISTDANKGVGLPVLSNNQGNDNGRSARYIETSKPLSVDQKTYLADYQKYNWQFTEDIFAKNPSERANSLYREALGQIARNKDSLAEATLERVCHITDFANLQSLLKLIDLYRKNDNVRGIKEMWKRAAVAAIRRGEYDNFLHYHYLSNYAENMYAKNPRYQYAWIDHDLNTLIELAAKGHPLKQWVEQNRKKKDYPNFNGKIKIGFLLEGFSQIQAPTQGYRSLAHYYDKQKFELSFYSRFPLTCEIAQKERYDLVADEFTKNGCQVRCPEHSLKPMEQIYFLTENIVRDEIDILFFQTFYFVPQFNFISCLRPAFFQTGASHQQPEYARNVDSIHIIKTLIPDHTVCCYDALITMDKSPDIKPQKRADFGIPENAVVLICANRDLKYRNAMRDNYWNAVDAVLERHVNAYFLPLGLESLTADIPVSAKVRDRIKVLGFRKDLVSFLKMADIYIDIFMHTSGAVMEAAFMGIPVLAIKRYLPGSPFTVLNNDITSILLPDTELLIGYNEMDRWHSTVDRLILDSDYRRQMGQKHQEFAKRFEPRQAVQHFLDEMCNAFWHKIKQTEAERFKKVNV